MRFVVVFYLLGVVHVLAVMRISVLHVTLSLCLRFDGDFPDEPGLAGVY